MKREDIKPNIIVRGHIFPEPVGVITVDRWVMRSNSSGRGLQQARFMNRSLTLNNSKHLRQLLKREGEDSDHRKEPLRRQAKTRAKTAEISEPTRIRDGPARWEVRDD